ncbi:MAG: BON domain-containing protein [Dehalococcoidia bacterium]
MGLRSLLLGGLIGGSLVYLFDPDRGRRRRAMARDRLIGMRNRNARRLRRMGRRTGAEAYAVRQRMAHIRPEGKPPPDDITLAHTVESELYRDPHVPKGRINISAERGVVVLRGQVEQPEQIKEIERKVRKVHHVHEVENLLHLPGTPAPNKAAALRTVATAQPASDGRQ